MRIEGGRGRWGAILVALLSTTEVYAQGCEPSVARIISVQGPVVVERSGAPRAQAAGLDDTICLGDRVRVGALGRAAVQLANEAGTPIRLDEGTTLIFPAPEPKKPFLLKLIEGVVHVLSRVPQALTIETPIVAAGIEGTEFVLGVSEAGAELWVFEGQVRYWNPQGQLQVASGEGALARPGQAPERRVLVKPREAVEWALYYPPLVDPRPESYPPALRATLSAYRANDLPAAFAALERIPTRDRDGRYFLLRAGLLLSVGRVAKAEADLAEAERADPKSGGVSALRSVIALVRDQKDDALRLAETGAGLDPNSPLPQAALSYAHQGRFEIEKALEDAKRAVELAPEDALLWARVSELALSEGDLDAALKVAKKAEALSPALARTQTVLGFAYLTRIEVDKAKSAFERAMQGDPADPLPRLGMGLAKIRDGDLEEGTRAIETAASLDPNNSLVRSYLGKAYYEQKRDGLASGEYEQAKLLDPKDPTPWFYDAIHKQTSNRPVEALHDLQRAIELNDNRAVYRSRLDLDEDRAARSTSLARIYDDLGFNQRGLVEASKTLSLDPADYSAHRFLSDTYGRLPRHQIARVSELLQAQLLQPININPVQPQLNETNLNIVTGAGPARAAFNEYSRLFERNRPQLILSGLLGNNDTFGDEAVLSGIYDRVSYSFGQFHYETDGFREKADVQHDIYDAFAQVALTEKLNVQFEYRRRETDQGDLRLDFDPNFVPTDQRGLEQDTGRLGLHLALSPRSDLVGSLIYSNRTSEFQRDTTDSTNQIRRSNEGYDAQGQYLFQSAWFNVALGGGIYSIDRNTLNITDFRGEECEERQQLRPPLACRTEDESSPTIEESNAFAYTNILFPKNLTWTLGLSYDSFDDETINLDKLNPKVGLQWDITDHLRLRAAYLRTLKRLLVVDQTIEPTQVAGFNQFFDDFGGTRTELLGAGLDIKATDGLFAGFEFTRRNLDVPIRTMTDDQTEDLYRAYTYWTPRPRWALSAEYRFESLGSENVPINDLSPLGPSELETTTIPLSIRYFSPLGVFAELGATFVQQDIEQRESESSASTEDFVVLDTAIGYRLPKRRGIISLEAKNLLDEDFLFQDLELRTSDPFMVARDFIPDRAILLRITLNFF